MTRPKQGVKEIHDAGFLHLDLKPANILITFDGSLKIADFGMASVWPAARGVELEEGDREYVSPEVLNGHYDKPADMFSLGLILLELAGNCVLPGQGTTWQQLRHGDLSSVPSLTWSEESARESSTTSLSGLRRKSSSTLRFGQTSLASCRGLGDPIKAGRAELDAPPAFMRDADNEGSLDRLVPWMMSPKPEDRPTIHQVLAVEGISWVAGRRRSSATIYEGDWGPADSIVASDTEMMDV